MYAKLVAYSPGRKFLPQVCLICLIHELCFITGEHCENHKSVLLACNIQNDGGTHECIDMNIYAYTEVCFIMFHLMLLPDFWYPAWKFSHLENRWVEFQAVSGFGVNEIMSKQLATPPKKMPHAWVKYITNPKTALFLWGWHHSTEIPYICILWSLHRWP